MHDDEHKQCGGRVALGEALSYVGSRLLITIFLLKEAFTIKVVCISLFFYLSYVFSLCPTLPSWQAQNSLQEPTVYDAYVSRLSAKTAKGCAELYESFVSTF